MTSTLESFPNLKRLFPLEFLTSISEESFLYRLLIVQRKEADVWRQHINNCLELAYRYNLVDADLEARLKKGDWETWEAAINELKVAKFIERLFGVGSLRWRPQGRERKVGEFEVILSDLDIIVFVEVKTILPRDLENLEQRVLDKLKHCIKRIPLPFVLSIELKNAGQTENFSERRLRRFLVEELSKFSTEDTEKPYELPDYQDRTELHLKIKAYPNSRRRTCLLGGCNFNVRWMNNAEYVKHSLSKAYEKLDNADKCSVVVLCPSPNYVIDEHDMLNGLLGTLQYTVSWLSDGSVVDEGPSRKPDGFFQPNRNHKLSAVGVYREIFAKKEIEGKLEIYHNPFRANSIPDSTFMNMKEGVRQLVKASNGEMKWLD